MLDELNNRVQQAHLVESIADYVLETEFDDLPETVVDAARIFCMDTLAVGIAGKTYDATDKALNAASLWGDGSVRLIGRPEVTLPAASAAFVNGMQIHALEWDALHEPSVVIAMCVPISAIASEIDSRTISGKELITAIVIAVEVAVFFGGETTSSPRFFRPSVAGLMGASMAMAKLRGFDKQQTIHTLGIAYSQASGTMQAHWEGSMSLPMQVGVAARAAHMAVDMVSSGMTGPVDVINGQFGYFKLFEPTDNIDPLIEKLGRPYKITQMAHKPYPAGRATQSTLTMITQIRQEHEFELADIKRIQVNVPPLVLLLVGRPLTNNMTPSYARLCLHFVAPLMLMKGRIDPRCYTQDMFSDPDIHALSGKLVINPDNNPDRNALGPQSMQISLFDGRTLSAENHAPLGSIDNPLSKQQREDKVRHCFALQAMEANSQRFIDNCNQLEQQDDCKTLLDILC